MAKEVQQMSLEREFAKNTNINREDIKQLREWLKTQPHLPEKHVTELDLVLAYYCCDRSSQLAKDVLDLNLTSRTLITAMFGHREVSQKILEAARTVTVYTLPEPDATGTCYLYGGLMRLEPKYFFFGDILQLALMIFDLWQYENGTCPWFSIIIDLKGVVWAHITRIDLMTLRQLIYYLEEGVLVKIKHIHFLNAPSFIDKFLALIKPLMKKELFEKIQVHTSDSPKAFENIPKKGLPKERGGEYMTGQEISEYTIQRLNANKKYFEVENLKRINKSLRPSGKHASIENVLGIQGSFKKLELD
ncbi:uncharacterized protein LOC121728274 [Aricia agestis]|uniref:uncharacterized protein LOC121728274 n=1 Tax=Aricia agestis TaxID=91739 RepID=UPI001C201AA9|nr:uncharacterized protein LOC121728274 [Aricia agestis]